MMKQLQFLALFLFLGFSQGYSQDLPDVWDFGATQLDASQYDNQLTVDIINSWYDASITPGSSGNVLPDFTAGDLSWTGGGNDRLRTTNTDLTRYDDNINDYADFKGRIYVNSRGATDRYLSLELKKYDEVTIWARGQDGAGNIHFEYAADPGVQDDTGATIGEPTELHFTANATGTYHIYDDVDKPSYYRIVRKSAVVSSVSGSVDVTAADGIPGDYTIVFTNENGDVVSTSVSGGTYSVDLLAGNYDVSLDGANGYSISSASALEVTESTSTFDVIIKKDGVSAGDGLTDVWDFGAEQLDASTYDNQLTVDIINSWYDASITPGSAGNNLPDFTAGDLSWTGGGSDRLRTSNTDLTRYDENVSADAFTGRVYVNSRGAEDRHFSFNLNEDDVVTIWALGQDGAGNIHFMYEADPSLQNDTAATTGDPTEITLTAKFAGTYIIYDDVDKPSYYRIERKSATYAAVTGNVDVTNAEGIPSEYSLVFTNKAGKTWSTSVSGGAYNVYLPEGQQFDVSLEGANGYSISSASVLNVTETTSTFDLIIKKNGASAGDGLTDVWDFGAEQLDASQFDNQLTVDIINSWYDASITPGSAGNTLPDFTAGDLSWTGGGSDRLRTSNTDLTRYDENVSADAFTGRVYVNSRGAEDRHFSFTLNEDDEVTMWALGQDGAGNIHFMYAADPSLQNDTAATTGDPTQITFTAKFAGTYIIYDDVDKPSYYRIERKTATYAAVTGDINLASAEGIPSDYSIVFTSDNGKTYTPSVSSGTYSLYLPTGHQYDISLVGAEGYSLVTSATLDVTESTSVNDIVIAKDGAFVEGLADVWDFGAEQLDASQYNNRLTVDIINSWYDSSITPGSSGNVLPDFTAGDLSWTGGGNDRLRTSNTELTRYDENVSSDTFTGRVYVNSRGADDRYMSLELNEDDKVSLWVLGQDGNGELHFEYVADPELQNEVAKTGGDVTEVNFVAKTSGTYHIYDGVDKPSYFRIIRKPATYVSLSGNVDLTEAADIPAGYSIVFSIPEGKTWSVQPADGKYQIDLPAGFDYSISVEGADGYVISNGASLSLTESTTTHDIAITKVEIYSVSGSITGLGDKIADLDLKFTASGSDALYVPKPVVDTDAATYTVKLEPNINYTISGGVDGYYIPENHLEITGETSHDIVFEPVPDGPFGDIDGDGVLNADDNCMYNPNPDQADSNNDGIGDVCEDDDGDGVINYDDNCPDTPEGTVVDVFGCEVFSLAANNYNITVHDVTCNGNGDGFITITAKDTNYTYNVAVSGAGSGSATLSSSNGFSASIENLPAGTYEICITVDGRDDYEQCFNVTVKGPTPLSAYSTVNYSNNTVTFALGGSDVYNIDYNGEIITTSQPQIVLDLQAGRNKFTIYTDSDCQGKVYKEVLMSENVVLFPNPTQGEVQVYISGDDPTINLSLVDLNGKEYMVKKMDVPSDRVINLDLTNYSNGIYLLLLKSESVSKSLKLIKS